MVLFLILLCFLIIFLVFFIFKTMSVIKKNNFDETIIFFKKYLKIVFMFLILTHGLLIFISFEEMFDSTLLYVLVIKTIIELIYFIGIYNSSRVLLNNLNQKLIFDKTNCVHTKKIGFTFVYLGLTEIITGLVIGLINLFEGNEFRLVTNSIVTLYLAIGMVMIIVSVILEKAVDLYEENSLTI